MTNDIGKIVQKCINHKNKLDNCFLTEDYKHYCKFVGEEQSIEARNKFGIPYIQRYYLCNKKGIDCDYFKQKYRKELKFYHDPKLDEETHFNPDDYNI